MSLSGMAPQNIGRYQILGELGKGAMGIVYKALDPTIGRTVALKTMRLDVHGMDTEEMLKRFRNEARAAGVLNHPNIVTVYDAGEQAGLFYMALELIEGNSLHALLVERRVLPVEQILDLSRQVCAGLDYAQSHGVIHRDIKPANIMITPDQTVKIMDFGIAKAGGGLTSAGQVLGTPNYMSPEQVKGRTLDGRSDLFSWGVILYEMVTGEKPFTGQNVTTIIYKIVNENPIPPRELDVTIHPGLSAVVTKALAKSPDERYQTGADLVRDLQNYKSLGAESDVAPGAGEEDITSVLPAGSPAAPAAARPASPPAARKAAPTTLPSRAPGKPARAGRQKLLLPVGAGVLVLLLLAIAGLNWYRHRTAPPPAAQTQTQAAIQPSAPPPSPAVQATPAPGQDSAADTATPDAADAKPATGKPSRQPRSDANHAAVSPPATDATGDLQFVSTPDGASIQIDGRSSSVWVTPFTVTGLAAGSHSISLAKAGYVPVTRTVDVVAGQSTPVNLRLAAISHLIGVTSDPAGAAILVDGKDSGKVTPAQVSVSPGVHTLVVRKAGYKDAATTTPRINPGDTYNFTPTLEPAPAQKQASASDDSLIHRIFGGIPEGKGALEIKTTPKGADILIAGLAENHKTPHKYFLDPGTYQVTLQLGGYKTVKKSVTVEKGKGLGLNETLQKP
jgi:serine/threonine-protein kinase